MTTTSQTTASQTTASQTIGPFWHLLEDKSWADLTRFGAVGEVISVSGRVLDGGGAPMSDACVEIWQASPTRSDVFPGFGRSATDAQGRYAFKTIMPGAVPMVGAGNSWQAPHFAVTIFARGLLFHLMTRCYVAEGAALAEDPVLGMVAPERRATLVARCRAPGDWVLDFHMQGALETVFFEI
ncbi:MAG: protocatechuate 3,4-dioxygenase subunit alpha [Acidocella sp.]|nr:protocatechuate 3,4-dioxygenase subunit alpha [Acidocella sp.]